MYVKILSSNKNNGYKHETVQKFQTQQNMFLLCSCKCHIQTSRVVQETDALMFIRPDTRQDDEILLPTLEGINTGHFNLL